MNIKSSENTKQLLMMSGIFGTMALLGGVLYQWFFLDCILWTCVPQRNFAVVELDISNDLFPSDARFGVFSQPSEKSGAIEVARKSVLWSGASGRASYMVERFGTVSRAKSHYHTFSSMWSSELTNARSLDIADIRADEYEIQCGDTINSSNTCHYTARYQEYVVIFSASIDRKMSEERFLMIASVIDRQINCKLNQTCVSE